MNRTYVDSDVLITAIRGEKVLSEKALEILGDTNREFTASKFLQMETQAKAEFNQRTTEVQFYRAFFDTVVDWAHMSDQLMDIAHDECRNCGINAGDAIHIASAYTTGASEFVTCEKSSSSIHRANLVPLLSLRTNII